MAIPIFCVFARQKLFDGWKPLVVFMLPVPSKSFLGSDLSRYFTMQHNVLRCVSFSLAYALRSQFSNLVRWPSGKILGFNPGNQIPCVHKVLLYPLLLCFFPFFSPFSQVCLFSSSLCNCLRNGYGIFSHSQIYLNEFWSLWTFTVPSSYICSYTGFPWGEVALKKAHCVLLTLYLSLLLAFALSFLNRVFSDWYGLVVCLHLIYVPVCIKDTWTFMEILYSLSSRNIVFII